MNAANIKKQFLRTFVLIVIFFYQSHVHGQSYDAGFTKYQRGDFKGAERSLLQALSKDMPASSKASSYKILGICQYNLGNKNGAIKSFKAGLALDNGLSIAASEVIDASVVDFFKKTKQEYMLANPPPAPVAPVAAVPTPTIPVASKVPVAGPDISSGSPVETPASNKNAGKKAGGTFVVVESTNPEANVMIDGIRAGSVNSQIEVEPGPIAVEIIAVGMEPKIETIEAIKDQINTIAVELTKPQKQKKMAKKKQKKRKKRSAEDDMFAKGSKKSGYNPAEEFESDTGLSPYAPAPVTYQPQPPAVAPGYGPQVAVNPGAPYGSNYQVYAPAHGNYFVAVLPFGAGQFQNRNVLMGIGFFGAEVGSLYYYYSKSKSAKNSENTLKTLKEEKAANGEELTEDDQIFVQESEAYINNLKKNSSYGLYGFGALWVIGAIEAIVNDPISSAAGQAPMRGPRPGRYGDTKTQNNTRLLSHDERYYKKDWTVHILPEQEIRSDGSSDAGGMKLFLGLKF
jgi:hypothetical protein